MNNFKYTIIGIDDVTSSNLEKFSCCTTDGTNVYVGTQNLYGSPRVLKYDGTSWSDITQNLPASQFKEISAIYYKDGNLLIGTGGSYSEYGKGQVWIHRGFQWDNLNLESPALTNICVRSITSEGSAIYAAGTVAFIWKYENSVWSIVWYGDFQTANWTKLVAIPGNLYAAGVNVDYGSDVNLLQYRSATNAWVARASRYLNDRLGNLNNYAISSVVYHQGQIYISTYNSSDGAEVHRLNENEGTWTKINTNGFGNSKNYNISELISSQNKLIAITENVEGPEIWFRVEDNVWVKENIKNPSSYESFFLLEVKGELCLVGKNRRTVNTKEITPLLTVEQRNSLKIKRFPDGPVGAVSLGEGRVRIFGPQDDQVVVDATFTGPVTSVVSQDTLTELGYMNPIQEQKEDAIVSISEQKSIWDSAGTNYYSGGPCYKDPSTGNIIMFALAKKGYWTNAGVAGTIEDYSRKFIRLAFSTDNGVTWRDLGPIIYPNDPGSATTNDYLTTPAYWIKDGYIYVYYSGDKNIGEAVQNLSVARALLSDVINESNGVSVTQWSKYYNGSFSEPGLGGRASDIIPNFGYANIQAVNGTYSEKLKKFIIVFSSQHTYVSPNLYIVRSNRLSSATINPANTYLVTTADGLTFSFPERIHSTSIGCEYPALIGEKTELGFVEDEFYIIQYGSNKHLYTAGSVNFYANLTVPRLQGTVNGIEDKNRSVGTEIYTRPINYRWSDGWQNDVTAQSTRDKRFGNNIRKIPIFAISNEQDFLSIDVPTRIEPISALYQDMQPFTTRVRGRKISYFGEVYNTVWTAENGKIREKSFGPSEWDIYAEYDIKDLIMNEEKVYGSYTQGDITITPITVSLRENKLYVLTKETDYDKFNYVIKVCDPREPMRGGYLESMVDFLIDIPLSSSSLYGQLEESISSMSFSEIDPSVMLLTTNLGKQLFYKLYFDYYYNNLDTNKIYLLEEYPNSKIQVM